MPAKKTNRLIETPVEPSGGGRNTEPLFTTAADEAAFWRLYADKAQPAIERACRSSSRSLTDNQMSAEDMMAWVDDRVWRMTREGGKPLLEGERDPDSAARRVVDHAKLLARWAYVALCRKHWRRKAAEQGYVAKMSRTERLAAASSSPVDFDQHEDLQAELDALRTSVNVRVRQQLAATWPDKAEAHRAALALGAASDECDEAIERVHSGQTAVNTVDQIRSRARKEVRGVFADLRKKGALILAVLVGVVAMADEVGAAATSAPALDARSAEVSPLESEQTGGRGGSGAGDRLVVDAYALLAEGTRKGEQTGGRGSRG